jgi:hypothetical protein
MIRRVVRGACYAACVRQNGSCYCQSEKPGEPACNEAQMAEGVFHFLSNVPSDALSNVDRTLRRIRKEFP